MGFLSGIEERVITMMTATAKLEGERELGIQQFSALVAALEGMKERYEQEVGDYKEFVDARHKMEVKRLEHQVRRGEDAGGEGGRTTEISNASYTPSKHPPPTHTHKHRSRWRRRRKGLE
jgi:hypothetical protein